MNPSYPIHTRSPKPNAGQPLRKGNPPIRSIRSLAGILELSPTQVIFRQQINTTGTSWTMTLTEPGHLRITTDNGANLLHAPCFLQPLADYAYEGQRVACYTSEECIEVVCLESSGEIAPNAALFLMIVL